MNYSVNSNASVPSMLPLSTTLVVISQVPGWSYSTAMSVEDGRSALPMLTHVCTGLYTKILTVTMSTNRNRAVIARPARMKSLTR